METNKIGTRSQVNAKNESKSNPYRATHRQVRNTTSAAGLTIARGPSC